MYLDKGRMSMQHSFPDKHENEAFPLFYSILQYHGEIKSTSGTDCLRSSMRKWELTKTQRLPTTDVANENAPTF